MYFLFQRRTFGFFEQTPANLDENEQKWLEKIFKLNEKSVLDIGIPSEKMAIIHDDELLTPLVINELFKTKQNIFPVMDKNEDRVKGVIFLDDITKIDSSDSKKAQKVMREEFFLAEIEFEWVGGF